MSNAFDANIIRTDEVYKVMDVTYSATGKEPVTVGMPLPIDPETDIDVIARYAPAGYMPTTVPTGIDPNTAPSTEQASAIEVSPIQHVTI